ncbi:MAG: sigma-70 family RNA polymerase sigma factor [Pseudomonadota bacterium]
MKDLRDTNWTEKMLAICDYQDREAFSELFEHFAPRIKAFLIKSGSDPVMAEECAQEAMITLWHKAALFDPTRASLSTWIFTIARNKKIDMLRKQNRPEPEELPWGPEPEPEAGDVIEMQQESEKLLHAIAALPQKQQEILKKAYYGDLTHQQLAVETGLPLGTIKSRIRLALEKLRHELE